MSIFEKIYNRINWQNKPSTETPINADNLNKMDKAIDDLDGRVVSLLESVNTNTTDISTLQSDVSANTTDIATLLNRLTWKTLTHDAVAITQVGEIAFTEIATIPNIDEVNEILIDFGVNNTRIKQLHSYRSGSNFSYDLSNMIAVDAYTLSIQAKFDWVNGVIAIRCLTNTWGLELVPITVPANSILYR